MAHIQNNSSSSTRRSLRLLTAERKSTTNESNIEEEEEQTTTSSSSSTRQAKSKALETLSITNNKRRIEPESDLNEEQEDNKRRTSSSSHRHRSNDLRRRRRSEKISNSKTFKRQRQSSSSEEEEGEDDHNNQLSISSKSKRHSAPILPHHHYNRRKKSDSEQQSEGTDTGNLCVRRGAGGREPNTVVSDPSTSNNNNSRRSRRYTPKSYIDYLTTGQSSTSRSSVPVTNTTGTENRSCDSNNTGGTTTNNPLHLFNSPAYYHQNSSSPPPSSSSAQSYSGIVPTTSYTSPFAANIHRNTKHTLQMSTESDTDPDISPTARDILNDPSFVRAAASSGSASAALFHTLSGRVQHLMNRVGGGSSINGRLQQYIQGIQSPDPDIKLTTLNELCSLLVMSNEDTLPGFQFRVLYPPLRECLADENEANAEIALSACRALTYLMEALPRSAIQVVEATPIFLSKLRSITSIDIAEQALTALEMISKRNAKQILQADGIGACLEYIDFFSITSQHKALAIVANCCTHILASNDFKLIDNHLENLSNRLRSDDKKTIEHICSIFSRLVENFHHDSTILCTIASDELLKTMQTMIIVQPSLINTQTFVSIIHMLYIFSAYCSTLAIKLLKMNIADTLVCLLTGSADAKLSTKKSITYKSAALATTEPITNVTSIQSTNNIELIPHTPQELYEIVSLIGEMMPRLPNDEPLFQVDQLFRMGKGYDANTNGYVLWHWQDDQGQLCPYSFQDSRTIEHAWQQHEEEVQLVISGRHYLLDLQQLQQINEETNQARFIKRVVTPTSPVPSLSTDELTTSPSPQTTTTVNNPIDPRQDILKDNTDLYNGFVQSLFTILYEVYNTSAGPAVKHRCLQSLLRMIYYSSSDILEAILKQQSISSHIASMLASSDYKIVISALQIAEILMKKLPEIFSVYFYREGVVHQIEILIGFGIVTSSNISITRTNQNPTTSQSQVNLVQLNESSSTSTSTSTIPTLSESFDEQQIHSYSNDPPPTHRGAATQLHPKTQSFPYRGTASSRRSQTQTEPNPTTTTTKVETRSQRGRIPPPSSSSRIKSSTRSMFDEMTSSSSTPPETPLVPINRPRPTRGGTTSGFFRPTTFDPAPYYPLPTGSRPRPSTPIYVPSPYLQQPPYAYPSSAPAAASLMMSTSMPTSVLQQQQHRQQQQQSQVTLSSQDKSKLKEWIQTQAQNFRTTYFSNNSSTSNIALQIINRLAAAVDILHVGKDTLENTKALRDIANIIAKGDVTPFEMVHSGLITKLFQYLTDDITIPNDRLERLKLFLNVFINLPYENKDDDDKDLKQFIIELHHTQLHNGKVNSNILTHLISKLHGCINQLEQFPIRVNDVAGRPAHSSALRLISTHQLKCNLVRHPQCKTLKQWNSGPVKIDPFALVSAIEKYLLLRGVASSSSVDPSGTIDDEESEVSNESDAEDVINVLAHSATMRLEFLINDQVIPNTMTLYQAIRMYSTSTQRTTEGESETDTDESVLPSSAIWTRVHTIHYRQLTNSSSTVAAVSTAIGGANTTASSNRLRSTTQNSSSTTSKSSKKTIKTPKRSSVPPTIDELWINGQCSKIKSLLISTLNESISSILTINDLSLNAISLLHILNSLNLYWYDLYSHTNTMINLSLTLTSKTDYLSSKLTSKVNRQLQDPVVIMMGQIPSWITEMGYTCSFLFPFETRQMIFYPCAFDRERAMQRLLDSSDMLTQQHHNDQTDRQSVVPRIERKKIQLSRVNILPEMEKFLDNWNSKHFLEVQYEDEVGFGLGPTLEAYALLSKELQKNGLELWRTDKIFDSNKDKDSIILEYVDTHHGLYPAPLGRNAKSNIVTKVRQKFKFLGKFMGKALMDSRMIDMPFSIVFYKWMLGEEDSLNIEDLISIDKSFYEQFKKLQTIVNYRDKLITQNHQITTNKINNKKRLKSKDDSQNENSPTSNILDENDPRLLLDGCKIEDLSLVFTLPGYPNIELKKGGKDCSVTIHNLDQYVNLVVYWTLVEGVRRQFESFRDGFNSIFPIHHLKCFYPDELHQVFCGSGSTELWDLKVLLESTRCDHGYNLNSRAVKWLFDIMINFDIDEQRAFLQFVTGSPRLPVGGFRMLHPPLTIVRKTAENSSDNINPDSFLPSVMTCVNYLKLPDYSSKEIMKLKLTTAIRDGQYAFLLS